MVFRSAVGISFSPKRAPLPKPRPSLIEPVPTSTANGAAKRRLRIKWGKKEKGSIFVVGFWDVSRAEAIFPGNSSVVGLVGPVRVCG